MNQTAQSNLLRFEYYQLFLDRLKSSKEISNQPGSVSMTSEKKNARLGVGEDGKRVDDVLVEECMKSTAWCLNLIDTEIKMCKELLTVEPTSKWGKLHLSFVR